MTDTLAEALPREQARVREVLSMYESCYALPDGIGLGCAMGIILIKQSLGAAEKAAAAGDVVEMLRCYQDLKDIQ